MSTETKTEQVTELGESATSPGGMVVGVDASLGSIRALKWAQAHHGQFGTIKPVSSWHYPGAISFTPGTMTPMTKELERVAKAESEVALEVIRPEIREPLVLTSVSAGRFLVQFGERANLIVVGTRGRGAAADTFLGSTSSYVVGHAKRPVAVVPEEAPIADRHSKVVVGIDGSDNSTAALVWAIENTPENVVIEAVHVWSFAISYIPEVVVTQGERSKEIAREVLEEAALVALKKTGSGRDVVKRLEFGDPRRVLESLSSDADLLIVGKRGTRGIAHLLSGSTTTSLLHKPAITTIVVHS